MTGLTSGADLRCPEIAAQPPLQPFVGKEVLPGPECQSDEVMIEEIRVRGVSNLHPVGTCRMGREVDGVVDSRLRVYGVQGVRVADASIMPQVLGSNTNALDHDRREMCGDGPRRRRGSLIYAATSP